MKDLKTTPLSGIEEIDKYLVNQPEKYAYDVVRRLHKAKDNGTVKDQDIVDILNYYYPNLYDNIPTSTLNGHIDSSFVNILKHHQDARIRKRCVSQKRALNDLIHDESELVRLEFVNQEYKEYWSHLVKDPSETVRQQLAKHPEYVDQLLLDGDYFVRKEAMNTIIDHNLLNELVTNIKQVKDIPLQESLLSNTYNKDILTHLKENGETRTIRATANSRLRTLKAIEQFVVRLSKEDKYLEHNKWLKNFLSPLLVANGYIYRDNYERFEPLNYLIDGDDSF